MDNTNIFETLFQSASEGIIVVDQRGSIRMANPASQSMFGYPVSLEGMTIEALLPESLGAKHRKHREKYHRHPQKRSMGGNLQLFGKRKEGTTFPVEVSLSPSEVNGEPVVLAFIVDITERKNRENIMLSMGRVFEDSFNEIYIFEADSLRFLRVNKAASRHLGYAEEELLTMTPVDIKPLLPVDEFKSLIAPLREGLPKIQFETVHRRKDGSTYPVEVHLQLTELEEKISFLAIIMDISERKFAEDQLRQYSQDLERRVEERTQELRESQKLYHAIARNFPDGMINVFDKELKYVFVEGKELYTLGVNSDTLIGTKYVDRLAPEIADETASALEDVFKGQAKSIDIKYKQNDYVLDAVPLVDDHGDIQQILVIEKNVTEQKRVQDKMQKNLAQERELNELKSRFVSMASHEFRTPLSTILTSASLLEKYQLAEQQERREKHIKRIKSSVHNLTGILNDFLSLDKLETGAIDCKPVSFNIQDFLRDVIDQVSPTLRKGQEIVLLHSGSDVIELDKHLLNNVLINLLSNASKYSDDGTDIFLTSRLNHSVLTLEVKDQGIGISTEDQKHLFERFFRANAVMNIQGTGLGLNIVKKYVELMGGDIKYTSELGQGTSFEIKLEQIPMS